LVLGFAVLVFGSIGFMYWWFGRDEAAPPPDGGPVVVATASPSPSASASVSAAAEPTAPATEPAATALTPTPEPDQELAELRASSRFLELAEHDRAQGAQWSQFGYEAFGIRVDGRTVFEWENKAQLWDSIAPRFRDACLQAGEPVDQPMWGSQTLVVSGISAQWNPETTGGRGQFIRFDCSIDSQERGRAEQVGGLLIVTGGGGAGEVAAVRPPEVFAEADYRDFEAAQAAIDEQLWEWVTEQPERGDQIP
nr:hypothetical protein [Euzebyales bacterium]